MAEAEDALGDVSDEEEKGGHGRDGGHGRLGRNTRLGSDDENDLNVSAPPLRPSVLGTPPPNYVLGQMQIPTASFVEATDGSMILEDPNELNRNRNVRG